MLELRRAGYASIESDASNGHGYFAVNCNGGSESRGLFYEVVFKRYADTHEANNSTFIAPSYALRLWMGPSFSWYGSGPQPFHTTADLNFVNSTLIGPGYQDADITYQSSELYQVTGGSNLGGNST